MARRNESIFEDLMELPWWMSVIVSAVVYIVLAFILPAIPTDNTLLQAITVSLPELAPYFAIAFLIPAPVSAIIARRKRRLLDNQKSIQSIRALSWKRFEELVAEAYRRQKYRVIENSRPGPDGGIDVRLEKDGHLHIVQCKQWRSRKVGVSIVREMFGVMTAEHASSVIVITSGTFTQEAKNFAAEKPIDLVDGPQLESLIGHVQTSKGNTVTEQVKFVQQCPRCGSDLVLRTARKGPNIGNQFYGCSSFPKCRYTHVYSE